MKVTLRKFEERDIKNKVRWINDSMNNQYLHYELPLEEEKTKQWYGKIKNRTDRYDAVIECDGKAVGVIGLLEIKNGQAEYYVTLGETEYKGKGIAKSATFLLLDYAFTILKLRMVYLYTETANRGAQRLFEKCGFIKRGIEKKSAVNRGKYVDRFQYRITAFDYYGITRVGQIKYETPVYQIENSCNQIYIKRDDLYPVSFGGNKARKAIYFFDEIEKEDADCVVTYGSSSSNHCRIISNIAASSNLPCYIIGPSEASKPTFNSKMMHLFGADMTIVPVEEVHDTIENKIAELKKAGKKPYFIPGGGHGNCGTQAYVDCYQEILNFEEKNKIHFDYIFFASGTGTTQAGLVCGQIMNHDVRDIIGISIARKNPRGRKIVLDSIYDYLKSKDFIIKKDIVEQNTYFEDAYTGNGYGKQDEEISKLISEMLIRHGIPMDSTYTAKAYLGMKKYLEDHVIKNKKILFIHTGGTPLFFDDLRSIVT